MSRSGEAALKRKRPGPNDSLADADRAILDVIKSKKDMAIWIRDIKKETDLPDTIVNKSVKTLLGKKLIKEVVNIHSRGKKHYMAADIEPSQEITGGAWYVDGRLDTEFIDALKRVCLIFVKKQKVATVDTVFGAMDKQRVVQGCTKEQVTEILNSLVLGNEIIEVKSTGLGEYHSIPVGAQCYRIPNEAGLDKGPKMGAMASIPCGMCPRIRQCTPDGVISPRTCVYYKKWLDIEF